MKKVLLSAAAIALAVSTGSAFAADLPNRKEPIYVPPPPVLSWNGFYGGLNIGGGWDANGGYSGYSIYRDPAFPLAFGAGNAFFLPNGHTVGAAGGVVGGGQAGYNFQFNPSIVVGLETDFQGTSIGRSGNNSLTFYPSPLTVGGFLTPVSALAGTNESLGWFGTVRGRAGWLVTPTLLAYGTAGFAYGQVNAWGWSNTRTGWTAGGGLEWMFAPNWSAKVEYLYVDLSSNGTNGGGFGWNWGYHFHPQINVVRAGVNYHFNWGAPAPILAKY